MTARLRTLARVPGAVVGAFVLMGIIGVALAASQLTGPDPLEIAGPPFLWPGEDAAFVLGTDIMGRDILAGIVHGARISLEIGLAAGLAAAAVGLIVGAVAGYFGKWVDQVLMRFAELFQIMPPLLFTIVLVVVVGPTIGVIIAGIVVTSWPQVARLVRAEAMRLKRSEFIQAAVVIGMNDRAILLKHVAPNVLSPAVVMISILAGNAILTESALSFLGMGDPNVMTWGNMIGSGREALRSAWYMTAIPGFAVLVTVTALNLLSNGVNDLLNPRRRAWL
ncbi:ABC transporter permease [Bradyrhizobium sp. dw_411]|uniref:ABC transporter permease n=1 Tax=Bradyrhizobium sp. dw_411 TaxID=2720082 RepID=UPI0031FED105